MARPEKVLVGEVGPRDGLQIERNFIPTATKIELIEGLIDAGVREIEYSSFVSPRAVPQLADAAEVLAAIDRSKGVHMVALVPNAKGAVRAIEAGVDELRVFVSASESHNRKNVNRPIEDSLEGFEEVMRIAEAGKRPVSGAIATSFGCPFEGDVPVEQVGMVARRFAELGMVGVGLGDTTGMATPPLVAERCRHLRATVPDLPIHAAFSQHPRHRARERHGWSGRGRRSLREFVRGPWRLSLRTWRHRQHLHRRPGFSPARNGDRDRDRSGETLRCRQAGRRGRRPHASGSGDESRTPVEPLPK